MQTPVARTIHCKEISPCLSFCSGTLILFRHIELTIISTVPPLFHLKCATSGGPLSIVFWKRNGGDRIETNNTFKTIFTVVDYKNAVYNHTLIVTENYPGTYEFFAQNPFITERTIFVSDSHKVEGTFTLCFITQHPSCMYH